MKKILFICLCMIAVTTVSAQIRWGVKAGANMSKLSVKVDDKSVGGQNIGWGFQGGLVMEYSFGTSDFAIQPELLYVQANPRYKDEGYKTDFSFNGLQLPINAKYSFGTEDLKLFIQGGPYVSYGLSAKAKTNKEDIDLYKEYDGEKSAFKRFDFGVGVGIGIELSKFTFTLGDQYGLLNTSNYDNNSIRTNAVTFSLGYFF